MRMKTLTRIVAAGATAFLTAGLVSALPPSAAAAEDSPLACADSAITKELENGSAWRMCARIHPIKGLILEQIEFKPATGEYEYAGYKRVLDQLNIAQLNVPYDTGHVQYNDITSYGFGKQYLMTQGPEVCSGEALDVDQSFTYSGRLVERTVPGICVQEDPMGLVTHAQETQIGGGTLYADQGTALAVSSISKISWYEYQQRVTFDDHGQIDVGLGATGDIAPGWASDSGNAFFGNNPKTGWPLSGKSSVTTTTGGETTTKEIQSYAGSHWHNAMFKVDFGIDKGEKQTVEQWDFASPGAGTRAPIVEGTGTVKSSAFTSIENDDHDELSWWRVLNPNSKNKDGHARSYEIVNNNTSNALIPDWAPSVTFTNYRSCEEYASDNLNAGCPGKGILDYVAGDTHELTDPVAWVNVGFHHTDKDEDQSPMPIHWQKFQLVPRDFFAQKPTITDSRKCINGPFSSVNAVTKPCTPENTVKPKISDKADGAAAVVPAVGKVLTSSTGTWRSAAQRLTYAHTWFRNGEAVSTGQDYTLTEADMNASITVKVSASATGFPTNVAESDALVWGTPPTTEPTPEPTTEPTTAPTTAPTTRPTTAPTPRPVVKSTPKLSVRLAATTVKPGRTNKVAVTVTAGGKPATGRVSITVDGKVRTLTLVKGKANLTFTAPKKPKGYAVRVSYSGSSTVKAGSTWVRLTVKK
ncbi:hypothetical protein H1W00_09850 [Aeromicrobium sp. Marseille-Q0843]|uniref:Amine oxidase n=1 Tax=Aeromicrobium phoceense TaxID=2754045 RepID=A0A838XE05_9ACTN|nr:hypothetical protein [Aeromicrobium phoceense]MBA4608775.1 hypothetical protein [Aeromicrobium phoceense]